MKKQLILTEKFSTSSLLRQGSDGSLMVINAKANVHWSPLQDEQFDVGKVIVLEQCQHRWDLPKLHMHQIFIHTHGPAWNK